MASLHSFFNSQEETNIHKSMSSSQSLSIVAKTNEDNPAYSRNKLVDGEIGVFSADKYFSGRMDEDEARKANLIARRRYQDNKSELLHHINSTPPSVYSESSLNSQNALLRRPRYPSKAKAPKKRFLAKLRCNCACSDKNSVEIEEYDDDDLIRIKRLQLQDLPCLAKTVAVGKVQSLEEQEEERKSLEVFGSSQDKGSRRFNLERRLNALAWDAIPKVEEIEIQGPKSGESIKDTESEASSDLFEIECLSCSANPVVLPGHTLDGGGDSSCVSPNYYAPSEASVEWSVVTASAADFSVVSDSEEQASMRYRKMLPPKPKKSATNVTELSKPRYGGLLSGCKSQKAVRVAEDVYSTTPKMMKLQLDTAKNVGFGSKYRKDSLYIQ